MLSFRDTGWVELYFPLSRIQLSNLQLQENTHTNLVYKDKFYTLTYLPILTPFYTVLSWDFTVGKLECLVSSFRNELKEIQDLFGKEKIQHFLYDDKLCIYLDSIHLWRYNNEWIQGYTESSFPVGSRIRIGFRIYSSPNNVKQFSIKSTVIYHES